MVSDLEICHRSYICVIMYFSAVCPNQGGTWISRSTDYGTGNNCYLFTPYNNQSMLFLSSEAASYCRSLALNSSLVPFLLAVDTQSEKVRMELFSTTLVM